jgi:hypothetical protein
MSIRCSFGYLEMFGGWRGTVAIFCILVFCIATRWRSKASTSQKRDLSNEKQRDGKRKVESETSIVPRKPFVWDETKPLQLRPFKPKYHLTMCKSIKFYPSYVFILNLKLALETSSLSELVEMDSTYLDRITLRRKVMEEYPGIALGASHKISKAVSEFYTWMFKTYLPTRYPTMFVLHSTTLENLVTSEHIPLTPPSSSLEALRVLGSHIDHDFLFLLPSDNSEEYILEGFVVCFPSGFDTSKKCGMTLREIHGPVPKYKEKLALSMDRFFERLEVGRVVKRANVCRYLWI